MHKVILEIADNGVIKTIEDDNINGAGKFYQKKTIYEFNNGFKNKTKFFNDISDDLGIDLGNNYDKSVLNFTVDWGSKYEPNKNEIIDKISELQIKIDSLKLYLNEESKNEES